MCGIIGIIGVRDVAARLLDGLRRPRVLGQRHVHIDDISSTVAVGAGTELLRCALLLLLVAVTTASPVLRLSIQPPCAVVTTR